MEGFIKQNWIAILSLLIALVGGMPGIIEIIKFKRQISIFKYSLVGIIIGNIKTQNNKENLMVLLSGTILNAGERALIPNYFDLDVLSDNEWIRLERQLIPIGAQFLSDTQSITLDKPWELDLQKQKIIITEQNPAYGHLMFISKILNKEIFFNNKTKLKLICTDSFNKQYYYEFPIITSSSKIGMTYPRHGLNIQPKCL